MSETSSEFVGRKGFASFVTDLFFPNRCPFCDDFISYDALLCQECRGELLWNDGKICPVCGKDDCFCGKREVYYDRCFAAAYYAGAVKKGIFDLKYRHGVNSADIFGKVLADMIKDSGIHADVIVPVPMSKTEKRRRGGNQTEIIAGRLTERLDIPTDITLLDRSFSKTAQHELSADERSFAVRTQYYALKSGAVLSGKSVMICDDVLTTGSTINRCAEILKKDLGADKVYAAVCASVSMNIR